MRRHSNLYSNIGRTSDGFHAYISGNYSFLQHYWDRQGCALLQPYDMEVGAGTSHTATFLRALGPEPWNAAYVQPTRRPKDGRYGENPNRLQHYYQFQVVLKPAPRQYPRTVSGFAAKSSAST